MARGSSSARGSASARPRAKLTENHVERQVLDFMRYRGWRAVRQHSGLVTWWRPGPQAESRPNRLGEPGIPDWLFIRPRRPIGAAEVCFVEIKRPGGKASAVQYEWIRRARSTGFAVALVDSIDAFGRWYAATFESGETHAATTDTEADSW